MSMQTTESVLTHVFFVAGEQQLAKAVASES